MTTKERLILAAEQLFAEQSPITVSAREIVRAAGVANASALQYHFGDRDGLLRALLSQHEADVETARHALLDGVELSGRREMRPLMEALVVPLAVKLADDSGCRYLKISGELVNRPGYRVDPESAEPGSSLMRWRAAVEELLDADARRLHRRFVVIRFVSVELARRAAEPQQKDQNLFVSQLVDLASAILTCPLSEESRLHLDQR